MDPTWFHMGRHYWVGSCQTDWSPLPPLSTRNFTFPTASKRILTSFSSSVLACVGISTIVFHGHPSHTCTMKNINIPFYGQHPTDDQNPNHKIRVRPKVTPEIPVMIDPINSLLLYREEEDLYQRGPFQRCEPCAWPSHIQPRTPTHLATQAHGSRRLPDKAGSVGHDSHHPGL